MLALKTLNVLLVRTEEVADSAGRIWLALGLVSLWGKIIEAEEGWRAQYAYPRMIWLLPPTHRLSGTEPEADERAAQTLIALLRRFYRQPVSTAPAPF